jgi:hypothetical protein
MWVAIYLPSDKEWKECCFETKEDAWLWIAKNAICEKCKETLEKGFEIHEIEDGFLERDEIDHPSMTPCGCELHVERRD